jgi:NADP-dependent 3-hydroxy acid dehydrogenase YdfG
MATLDGTVALVTGASSGIGRATARRLAAEGAAVVVAARRQDRLAELAAAIGADGGRALAVAADLTDRAQAENVVERAVAELRRLDTVVNNAGVMLLGPAQGSPVEDWDTMIALTSRPSCT